MLVDTASPLDGLASVLNHLRCFTPLLDHFAGSLLHMNTRQLDKVLVCLSLSYPATPNELHDARSMVSC